jgi:outer membrane protein assembly factor BamE (lipoprotein component of BamABCDE complex)
MRGLALSSACAAALVLASPGAGAIVVQHGIAGVRLHMTKSQVRALLGTPQHVQTGRNDFGRYTTFRYQRVSVTFQSGVKVTGMRTSSPLERTTAGVGVGSTTAKVKAKVPGVRCSSQQCVVGRFTPGRVVTSFLTRHGRVSAVVVGIVID